MFEVEQKVAGFVGYSLSDCLQESHYGLGTFVFEVIFEQSDERVPSFLRPLL